MKVTVIGGGSTYTPELVSGFIQRVGQFPLDELCLMDIDRQRLETVGGFARRLVEAGDEPFKVSLTEDRSEAIQGAAYVITQIRVGHMAARREDEYLGRRHGLIGQETTGVGGMAKALRTIPVILAVADDMRRLAPGALLVNFANPAGLVTQALSMYAPDQPAVGVCNVPITAKMLLLPLVEKAIGRPVAAERLQLDTLGLNHLTWHRGLTLDGEDVWEPVFELYLDEQRRAAEPDWPVGLLEQLGMIPNYYLNYYYFTRHKLAEQEAWPPSRAEEVMEIEKALLAEYADPRLEHLPEDLMKRGGAYYSTMATQLLAAHYNDLGEVQVVNTPNRGAVAGWPADWVLEIPAQVSQAGVRPLSAPPLPPVCSGLIAQVKAYELLAARAAVEGDRRAAYQALLAHPLGPAADQVADVLEDMLETNREYLPQFWEQE
jgi:6-phospho-beta-glucosidase